MIRADRRPRKRVPTNVAGLATLIAIGWTLGASAESAGRTFRLRLEAKAPDVLRLRGFVGFELIGQTQMWFRVQPQGAQDRCTAPAASASE